MKPPAFQFYSRDWLSSTAVLSLAERGAFITLLAWSWDNGPVPEQPDRLARLVGATPAEFGPIFASIRHHWTPTNGGLVCQRLERERAKQAEYRAMQAERGRKSGEARARTSVQPAHQPDTNQRSTSVRTSVQPAHEPEGQPEGNSSSSSSSSSSIFDLQTASTKIKPSRATRSVAAPKPDARFDRFWATYPRKVKKPKALAEFSKLNPDEGVLAEMSAALAWQCRQDDWVKDRGRFIPHPDKWLRDRRWEDEPINHHLVEEDPLSANDDVWAQVDARARRQA